MNGKDLKEIRCILKLNQTEFAELFGYTRQSIGNFEKGRQDVPDALIFRVKAYLNNNNGRSIFQSDEIEIVKKLFLEVKKKRQLSVKEHNLYRQILMEL